jgi:ferredoxin-thioredoxin reductase catalytic subunit
LQNEKDKLIKFFETYCNKHNYKLTEDKELLNTVIEGLIRNRELYKSMLCPCFCYNSMPQEEWNDHRCPCKFMPHDVEVNGACHCLIIEKKQ